MRNTRLGIILSGIGESGGCQRQLFTFPLRCFWLHDWLFLCTLLLCWVAWISLYCTCTILWRIISHAWIFLMRLVYDLCSFGTLKVNLWATICWFTSLCCCSSESSSWMHQMGCFIVAHWTVWIEADASATLGNWTQRFGECFTGVQLCNKRTTVFSHGVSLAWLGSEQRFRDGHNV